ncbi:MAG: DUF4275 family protein [Pseudomonadota bacterium]
MSARRARAVDLAIAPEHVLRRYTKAEAMAWAEQWMAVFGQHKQGTNTGAYMWHVFSFDRYASVAGAAAQTRYEQEVAPEYIVLSNARDLALLTYARPGPGTRRSDFVVFPSNMAWTMAFTHEDGWLGPYFAMHPDYPALSASNIAQVAALRRKREEMALAVKKGWA